VLNTYHMQGRWQKNFRGGGGKGKKIEKDPKVALLSLFQVGANGKKTEK